MGDYSGYFGGSATYSSPYANTYSSITGAAAEPTYTAYPAGTNATTAVAAAAYAATTPGTTYTSYTLNAAGTTTPASTTPATYNYVDWASAATSAAISAAASANQTAKSKFTGKPSWYNKNKNTGGPPKEPSKTYYCELCKVSCMGALTYKEHCNGQKHKKKEKEKESGAAPKPSRGFNSFGKLYRCELCDISCTGEQAFSAHMTGSKHNKTVLLFRKLGKPIPGPTLTNSKGEKEEVDLEKVKEELAKKAERIAKEEADRTEKREKRNQQAEERAKKRLEEIESRRKMMDERRSKWEEERWKREEEWRSMQDQRDEEWKQWQETEQCEHEPAQACTGFASREGKNNDNALIMQLHDVIYPNQGELTSIKNIVKVTEDSLKIISDTMKGETEAELKDKGLLKEGEEPATEGEDAVETRALKGCVRIGDLADGLLLSGDKDLEMLVLCTDKPTVYMLQNVKDKFEELLTEAQKKALKVTVEPSKGVFVVEDTKEFKVTVSLSSKVMIADATAASVTADVAGKVLDRKNCMRVLEESKRAAWFQAHISSNPSAVITIRLFNHLARKEGMEHWRAALKPWLLHVVIGQILVANPARRFSPGDLLRRTLEALSAGALFTRNGTIPDPCTEPAKDLTEGIPGEDAEKVTADAQAALRNLVFNKLHLYLGVEPFAEPETPAGEEHQGEGGYEDVQGYDGTPGHMPVGPPPGPMRMRGMRPRRPPMGGPYGGPYRGPPHGYGGPHGYGPPHGYGGPPPFPSHLGPRGGGQWRGPPPHMRRGGPNRGYGPRGYGPPRHRGPRPFGKNRKRKPEGEGDKSDVKKEKKEDDTAPEVKKEDAPKEAPTEPAKEAPTVEA